MPGQLANCRHGLGGADSNEVKRLFAREREQVPRQPFSTRDCLIDGRQLGLHPRIVRYERYDSRAGGEDLEQIIEIMREASGQLSHGFVFLELSQLILRSVAPRGLLMPVHDRVSLASGPFHRDPYGEQKRKPSHGHDDRERENVVPPFRKY